MKQPPNDNDEAKRATPINGHTVVVDRAASFSSSLPLVIGKRSDMNVQQEDTAATEDAADRKECFAPIQSRRLWSTVAMRTCRLCPSMDLLVFGLTSNTSTASTTADSNTNTSTDSTTTIWLHRTVSWEKLSTIVAAVDGGTLTTADTTTTATTTTPDTVTALTAAAWRPDGRLLAVASGSVITLYNVEDMLDSSHSSSSIAQDTVPGRIASVGTANQAAVTGLLWAHVGQPHPTWNLSDDEREDLVRRHYQSRLVDRATTLVLPPSAYHTAGGPDADGSSNGTSTSPTAHGFQFPTCRTPLSLLVAATCANGVHCFLHGRYPILHLPDLAPVSDHNQTVQMVASTDLSHILVHFQGTCTLSLASVPAFSRHRHDLQSISAWYCSTTAHIQAIQDSVASVVAAWKSSLKPLDLKLEKLLELFGNYGLTEFKPRAYLTQYILSGHTRTAPDLSNAADQFFTSLNDQLMQRLERSLQAAVASVETKLVKGLVSPAQALVVQSGDLHGLARFAPDLLSVAAAQRFQECAELTMASISTAHTELIQARFRLRDFLSWLRSTAAQIKARGTAPNSVQRENAKKRRVPEAVVQRMLGYLQAPSAGVTESITERILGLHISNLLLETSTTLVPGRPPSPNLSPSVSTKKSTPTVPYVAQKTSEAAARLFEHPRFYLAESVQRTDLDFGPLSDTGVNPAITTRLGSNGVDRQDVPFGEEAPDGFFAPILANGAAEKMNFRQWSVIAKPMLDTIISQCDCVQLHAIPLSWTGSSLSDDVDEDDQVTGVAASFFLSALLQLPPNHVVVDLAFYGNDGKSSLSSGIDSGTGKEARQLLALLVARRAGESVSLEVWLVPYDSVVFSQVDIQNLESSNAKANQVSIHVPLDAYQSRMGVQAMPSSYDPEEPTALPVTARTIIFAKTRPVSTVDSLTAAQACRLTVSGSRGIAAVVTQSGASATLDLLDLEDEEEEEDDQSMDDA